MRYILISFLLILLLACAEDQINPVEGDDRAYSAIVAVNEAMASAYRKGDVLAVSAHYAEDATVIGQGFQITGREAIDKYWNSFAGLTEDWELTAEALAVSDSLAYQVGQSTISYRDPDSAEVVTDTVRFTLVWRKDMDGNWKILVDHYSGL